jgi:hypothetical protein
MRPYLLPLLCVLAIGCSSLDRHPSLGTYFVDDEQLVVLGIDAPDTVAVLTWGDTVEVIDAPMELRSSDDLFVVRTDAGVGRAERDLLISDLLFRSKYSHGRMIRTSVDGRRFYLDEFRDTVMIRHRTNVARKSNRPDDEVEVSDKELSKKSKRSKAPGR